LSDLIAHKSDSSEQENGLGEYAATKKSVLAARWFPLWLNSFYRYYVLIHEATRTNRLPATFLEVDSVASFERRVYIASICASRAQAPVGMSQGVAKQVCFVARHSQRHERRPSAKVLPAAGHFQFFNSARELQARHG